MPSLIAAIRLRLIFGIEKRGKPATYMTKISHSSTGENINYCYALNISSELINKGVANYVCHRKG